MGDPKQGYPPPAQPDQPSPEAYTIFTPTQRRCILIAACSSSVFSGLSSMMYYPAITALSHDLSVSITLINLTINSYLIVSSIAPSIFGDMADQIGRRPVTIMAFSIYFGANLGLALQSSYAALVTLRCLQAAGASSTFAFAFGSISDISPPSTRGSYVGVLQGFTNSASCLGPTIGGILAQTVSWRWIFWLLCILSGTHLSLIFVFLPETSRKLVGNGSLRPPRPINRSVYNLIAGRKQSRNTELAMRTPPPLRCPNPVACLVLLFQKGTFVTLLVGSLQYTIYGCLSASLSTQMIRIYHLNYLQGGLVYLTAGVGCIITALSTGKLLDHDFRTTAREIGYEEAKSSKDLNDLSTFPIEKARLKSIFIFLGISTAATLGYGWSLQAGTHMAVPLIMQFFTASSQVAIFTVAGTLLTDLNPERSATVQASYSLVRCMLSAAGLGALQPMIDGVGLGWCFTILAVVGASCVPMCAVLRSYGSQWRKAASREKDEMVSDVDA